MNISIEPTTDVLYIKSILMNQDIYSATKDDSLPATPAFIDDIDVLSIPGFFLKVMADGVQAGLFWLIWKGSGVEAHTGLLPNCRGRNAIKATKMAIDWVFSNTKATFINSHAWSDSPAVKWFCLAVGMSHDRTEKYKSTRNGLPVLISHYTILKQIA